MGLPSLSLCNIVFVGARIRDLRRLGTELDVGPSYRVLTVTSQVSGGGTVVFDAFVVLGDLHHQVNTNTIFHLIFDSESGSTIIADHASGMTGALITAEHRRALHDTRLVDDATIGVWAMCGDDPSAVGIARKWVPPGKMTYASSAPAPDSQTAFWYVVAVDGREQQRRAWPESEIEPPEALDTDVFVAVRELLRRLLPNATSAVGVIPADVANRDGIEADERSVTCIDLYTSATSVGDTWYKGRFSVSPDATCRYMPVSGAAGAVDLEECNRDLVNAAVVATFPQIRWAPPYTALRDPQQSMIGYSVTNMRYACRHMLNVLRAACADRVGDVGTMPDPFERDTPLPIPWEYAMLAYLVDDRCARRAAMYAARGCLTVDGTGAFWYVSMDGETRTPVPIDTSRCRDAGIDVPIPYEYLRECESA